MADEKEREGREEGQEYEEPTLVDLEDVAGGAAAQGPCGTSGSGSQCDGGCLTGGSAVIEEQP
jgi:hypothetical protein